MEDADNCGEALAQSFLSTFLVGMLRLFVHCAEWSSGEADARHAGRKSLESSRPSPGSWH